MVRKIFKSGDNIVVSLPKEMLDALRLGEGAEVNIEFDQVRRIITVAPAEAATQDVDEELARQVSAFIEQYRPALEALARTSDGE